MKTINLTTNLKLQKPTSDEKYNVQTQNTNMDILDSSIKSLQDKDATLTKQTDFTLHTSSKNNPHNVTKEQLGLSNLINQRQIPAIQSTVTDGGIPIFDSNGYTLKDSGYTIGKSVPEDAEFTDTLYVHPESGVDIGEYTRVSVDSNGHVTYGSNPTTLEEYGITDAAPIDHSHTAEEIGADVAGSADNALNQAKEYTDLKVAGQHGENAFKKQIVESLPIEDIDTNTIYLVLKPDAIGNDNYNEYINLDGTADGYEWIGNTFVDLTDYYNKIESNNLFLLKANVTNNLNTTVPGMALDATQGMILADMITESDTRNTIHRIPVSAGKSVKLVEFMLSESERQSVTISVRGMHSPGTATVWMDFGYGYVLGSSVEVSDQYYIPRLQIRKNYITNNFELWIVNHIDAAVLNDIIIIDNISMGEYSGILTATVSDGSETDTTISGTTRIFIASAYIPQLQSYEHKSVPKVIDGNITIPNEWSSKYGHLVIAVFYSYSSTSYIATYIIGFSQFSPYTVSKAPILLNADGIVLSTVVVNLMMENHTSEISLAYSHYPTTAGLTISDVTAHPM
ncbi:hypothetical protein [Kineothrix sp. MB12-C1]|uniref:hypothetical protein n=1 Tax=Kineothrix sp. MB12-C1 TaxID=3070215 RepID=UPI0027D3372A|nr:hypothetical protein [Kineothrix sp. MB12-C1]WMC93162.1 hypothetical protein RBB56_02415 [Kineothrix sp. MB12-C1]